MHSRGYNSIGRICVLQIQGYRFKPDYLQENMNKIKKNINQRNLLKKIEYKKIAIKALSNNLKINTKLRWKIQQNFFKLPTKSSITRIKNLCIITGRSKSVYKKFKLSRIQLKLLITNGLLPGLSKYSW